MFEHVPHPHVKERKKQGPQTTGSVGHARAESRIARFNRRVGLRITLAVGSMGCAYAFAAIALVSLPSAIGSGNLTILIAWLSSNFLQLVLLPILMTGQNIQGAAADKRAEQTFLDAEATLHEAGQIQAHLAHQDAVLADIISGHGGLRDEVAAIRDALERTRPAARRSSSDHTPAS